ncbi:molecular chaperone [Klebsiella sp. I138]|uniref:fimbrial biogenesis chaperone n=1 Tax=Klebsiella sp. I138 TaxID=2755385 RepID=UPI003DA9E53C
MHRRISIYPVLVFLIMFLSGTPAFAGVVITGTRIVYPGNEKEVTVKVDNDGEQPVLVQIWSDRGNADATPDKASAPFLVTPPVKRINGGKGQMFRLIYTGENLPVNKESLFWLNVLEIPAEKKGSTDKLKMAFRSRLKIFFRPAGLQGSAEQAFKTLTWKKVKGGIEGDNPTPYFVSVASIAEDKDGRSILNHGGMIAPGSKAFFPMKNSLNTIYPSFINDFGGLVTLPQPVVY